MSPASLFIFKLFNFSCILCVRKVISMKPSYQNDRLACINFATDCTVFCFMSYFRTAVNKLFYPYKPKITQDRLEWVNVLFMYYYYVLFIYMYFFQGWFHGYASGKPSQMFEWSFKLTKLLQDSLIHHSITPYHFI